MRYIVASNSFISPQRGYSPIEVARSLWAKISALASEHKIYSLDKVKEELYLHDDELKEWMKANMPADYFLSSDHAEVITKLQEIIAWADSHTFYSPKANHKFRRMDKTDLYLVTFAAVDPAEGTIVSMERPAPRNAGEIKLPDACAKFGVRCLMLQDMFREMGESY